ncbi:uncharacterized protein N7473_005943 [Penicillium subrubescens]|uniref:Uncharacterized protein n=1 Tax=Penicillium subrubescens TaxID=1316194 RepID=A0A1Q5UEZ1_9EURO|nr:uncharacterized protein N7473_005943 [Penicillium subrubescens]KAJ5896544.1 hypothetical protein N7473_005943 [Penicillium subrubescens]OKP11041.1 hypothetical protein PENSUB_3562 [Penicillium subrubescens]
MPLRKTGQAWELWGREKRECWLEVRSAQAPQAGRGAALTLVNAEAPFRMWRNQSECMEYWKHTRMDGIEHTTMLNSDKRVE